mgnify:CR=1 FL=1
MNRRSRPVALAAAAGMIVFAALAAIVGARGYDTGETPVEAETLQRIARKNDAAAKQAAAAMEARAQASQAAAEARKGAEQSAR